MLSLLQFKFLESLLRSKPIHHPKERRYRFNDEHRPRHLFCRTTALHLERKMGWQAQSGVQWIDKHGLLLPWPHVINWVDGELVDHSLPLTLPKLGFSTLPNNDIDVFSALKAAVEDPAIDHAQDVWVDPFLRMLHDGWYDPIVNCFRHNKANRPQSPVISHITPTQSVAITPPELHRSE